MAKAQPKTAEASASDDALTADPAKAPATAGAAPGDGELVDVRVLAAVTIGGERFEPDDVIEGMPDNVAQAYAGSVDPHPDAVAYARATGAPVKHFPGAAHAED